MCRFPGVFFLGRRNEQIKKYPGFPKMTGQKCGEKKPYSLSPSVNPQLIK